MRVNKTILVTGNAGFIGSSLTEKLLELGYQVIGVDNFNDYYSPTRKEENIKPFESNQGFKQYRIDILDDQLDKVFKDHQIDLVIHLAARAGVRPSIIDPLLYSKVNIGGTVRLLELCRKFKIQRFIFGSSSSVYGNQAKVPFSETDKLDQPVSPYALTKKLGEEVCKFYSDIFGLSVTALRFFTVYGPKGRPDMAPYLFTKAVLESEPITRYGDGSSFRDYTYIADIVEGIIKAIEKPFKFEIFNLGNSHTVKLTDFISLVEKLTGKKAKIIEKPRNPADVEKTYADISKAKKLLNWEPKVKIESGMIKFLDWFRKNI